MDSLTQYEKLSMNNAYNLSDGHARQNGSISQQKILDELSRIYSYSLVKSQLDLESEFKRKFYQLSGQISMYETTDILRSLICYSSSNACEIVGNFLRINNYETLLIEPTFDNLANILKRHNIKLTAISESVLKEDINKLDSYSFKALFLVLPNNPTGTNVTENEFIEIAKYCRDRGIILILDFAFRFFSTLNSWDQYKILNDNKVDFIILEDTGKTWAMADLKLGMISPSASLFAEINKIHDDYLLNVSPFILALLIEFIDDSINQGIYESVKSVVEVNRAFLRKEFSVLPVNHLSTNEINVDWLLIKPNINISELYVNLVKRNVHILPGNNFYWNTPNIGNSFIRIPLSRNSSEFNHGILTLKEELLKLINAD